MNDDSLFLTHSDLFCDTRIAARLSMLLKSIIGSGTSVINRCCPTHSKRTGAYRLLNNERIFESNMGAVLYRACKSETEASGTRHVLCIEDTTELNYNHHLCRIGKDDPDIGPVTRDSHGGYFLHPMLVVDPEKHFPLGFSSLKIWNRSWDKKDRRERGYKGLPVEEKESFRWIESACTSRKNLPEDVVQTIIADREGDIYEALYSIPASNARTHLLIRSSSNRVLAGEDILLHEKMQSLPLACTYELKLKGNHKRKSRVALLELRFCPVTLKRPAGYPESLSLNCIYVKERPQTVPQGEEPIEWRLLTTHAVETVSDALKCVQWYKCRWYIEELFRVLKSEGLDIESSQLESGAALKKLLLVCLCAALRIPALKSAYEKKDETLKADLFFTPSQIACMQLLLKGLEGKTRKLQNPYLQDSLAWAAWIIARLGGWAGYESAAVPGYITIKRGIDVFMIKFQVFEMMSEDG